MLLASNINCELFPLGGDDLLMGLTRAERLARRKSTVDN